MEKKEMLGKLKLNRSLVLSGVLFAMGSGFAQASILSANTSYDMFIRTGTSCYAAADCTALNSGIGADDNGGSVTLNGIEYGSSIAGDGWAGIVRFKTDGSGENLTGVSYNLDQYQIGPPDFFVSWNDTPNLMTGTIDAAGNMSFTPTGRMAISGLLSFFGVIEWNLDNSTKVVAPTNAYQSLTTGTSTSKVLTAFPNEDLLSLTGNALTADGNGGWNATLVSAGNFGEGWPLSGTPYTEVWDVNIQAVSSVPIPAAMWLFGSGLLVMVGLVRKKHHL